MARVAKKSSVPESSAKKNLIIIGGFALCGLVVSLSTILYARAHDGQLNVAALITQSNRVYSEQTGDNTGEQRPEAKTNPSKPNGGLVGTGKPTPPPPPAEVLGTTTATTSPEVEGEEGDELTTDSDDIAEETTPLESEGVPESSVSESEETESTSEVQAEETTP